MQSFSSNSKKNMASLKPSMMATLLLLLSVTCLIETSQALRRPSSFTVINYRWTHTGLLIGNDDYKTNYSKLRGGATQSDSGPIELNPGYKHYSGGSSSPPRLNEHEAWLQEQQQHQNLQQQQSSSFTFGLGNKDTSLIERIQNYFVSLHQISPSLCWTTLVCMGVFGMWQTPRFTRRPPNSILSSYFVNSHQNIKKTLGLSLVLPAFSHISPYHLLVNLLSLSHLGPSVRGLLQQQSQQRLHAFRRQSQWKSDMWPLLLSSSAFSNAVFLFLQGRGASSLGLSGVTMSLLAIQARAFPNHQYGIVLGVIPVSFQAKYLLQILLVASLVGSLFSASSSFRWGRRGRGGSQIAHGAHFGGLVYGILYYELVILGLTPQQVFKKMIKSIRR
jgi:membrane associated rhomboid family serine protease